MDFSNSVIMPREDFVELQTAAWDQTPPTAKERVAQTIQTTAICMGIAAAATAGSWGWVKAMDWYDERQLKRRIREAEAKDSKKEN